MHVFTPSSNVKWFRTGDDVAPVEVCAHLGRCVEAGRSFVAHLGFPQNFLVYFHIPDTSDDAVCGNVVSLVKSAKRTKGSSCVHMWEKACRRGVKQVVLHTFVFLPGSPPR